MVQGHPSVAFLWVVGISLCSWGPSCEWLSQDGAHFGERQEILQAQWQRRVPSRCPVITVFKASWRALKLQLSGRLPSEVIFGIYSASPSPALSLLSRFCHLYPDLRGVFLGIKISQQMVGSLGVCRAGKRVAALFKMTMDTGFLLLSSAGDSTLHFSGCRCFLASNSSQSSTAESVIPADSYSAG